MKDSVVYNTGSVQVKDPRKDSVVVYAHPGDKINLDFDISTLKKEVINGDLVIKTQSGGTVTIANYSIMFMQNQFPVIVDSLAQEYGYYDFLDGAKAGTSSDNPDSVIVDRIVSTPKANINSGDFLATGREFLVDDYAIKELVGMIDVEEQHPILANDVSLNPYILLTLYPEGIAKNDVPVTFRYAGRTILNQEQPSTLPIVTRISNPKSDAIYGTKRDFFTPEGESQSNGVRAIAGGGDLKGNENSDFMFKPESADYSSSTGSIYYEAYTGNSIRRGLQLYLTDSNAIFESVILQDIPAGVNIVGTEKTQVQPLGNGSFLVTPTSQGSSIDIYFEYNRSGALDFAGNDIGLQEIMQQIRISITGYNVKYEQKVIGNTEVTFDFREVDSAEDINNFSLFNTYTYSTLFDPLLVTLTRFDDKVKGGDTSHIYDLLEGNDYFISGMGSETVYMGEGDDTYIYNFGSDTVDGKATKDSVGNPQLVGTDVLRFDHEAYETDANGYVFNTDVKISFVDGDIKVRNQALNSRNEKDNSLSTFKNFDEIYLEEDTGPSADKNNSVEIGSTKGFRGLKIYSGGDAGNEGDKLTLTSAGLIDFTDADGASITTVSNRVDPTSADQFDRNQKIVFAPGTRPDKDRFSTIVGSSGNDYFLASGDKTYNVTFYGGAGINTADFSQVQTGGGLTFDVNSGEATYGASQDILKDIKVVIGTAYDDIIYGSGTGSMSIYGVSEAEAGVTTDDDTVSYEKFQGNNNVGVTIDYVTGFANEVIYVLKSGGDKDQLFHIENVVASQANDTFILSMRADYNVDGMDGDDTLDYSQEVSSTGIIANITSVTNDGATGNVEKGAFKDSFQNIEGIIGTNQSDNFIISGAQEAGMNYDGKSGTNTINYSGTSGVSISYNLSLGILEKVTSTGRYTDNLRNFAEIIGTLEDDVFIATDNAWEGASDLVYDAYQSKFDPSTPITEKTPGGDLENAGDVLWLNYEIASGINLVSIEQQFKNFNTLRLAQNYNNTIEYGDTNFSAFWGSTSNTVKDKFTAIKSPSSIIYEVTGATVSIGTNLTLYNFDILEGSNSGTTFNVAVDSSKLDVSYYFVGGQSLNDVLDYTKTTVDLKFDLGTNLTQDGTVTKGNGTSKDTFTGIEKLIGGSGDDIFYLNPLSSNYQIDGGLGDNIVSFKNYTNAVSDADINYDLFKNISGFELTSLDDSWLIAETASDARVLGGAGIDVIRISNAITGLNYEVGETDIILNIEGPNASKQTLSSFEVLYGTDASQTGATDKVVVSAENNTSADNKSLYFLLNNGNVDYSGLASGVTFSLYTQDRTPAGVDANMMVSKGTGSFDYYLGVNTIKLTGKDDIIKLDLSDPDSYKNVNIDAGAGTDTIDLSDSSLKVEYDAVAGTLNGETFNITGWEILKTGDGDDKFTLSKSDRNQIINSGLGANEVILSDFNEELTFNFAENGDLGIETASEKVLDATGIKKVTGGSANNIFYGSSFESYTINGGTSTNNTVDYSKTNDSAGFSFDLSNDADTSVTKGSSGNIDYLENIQKVIGTKNDDTFTVKSDAKVTSINGGDGTDELFVEVASGSTAGFEFDLDNNVLKGGGLQNDIELISFEILNGSAFDDIFTVTSEDVLVGQGAIRGNGGVDTLNAKIVDGSGAFIGLYLDLSKGVIYRNENGNPSNSDYLNISGISKINLGDGDNVFIFTGALPTPPGGGKYEIDLGAGTNNLLSFEEVNFALVGSYQDMIDQVTGGAGGSSLVDIKGKYGLKLTNYNDELKIGQNDDEALVNGGGGRNSVDYSGVTDNITIDLTAAMGADQEVTRGSKTDKLTNFETFILGSGNDFVKIGGSVSATVDGGAGDDTISYEDLTSPAGLIARLTEGTIFKNEANKLDRISNFEIFKDSQGDDTIYASVDYKEIWGNGGTDTLNLSSITDVNTDTVTYGSNAVGGDDRNVLVSGSKTGSVAIKSGTSDKDNSFKKIIFGDTNALVRTNTIEGRNYQGKAGKTNHLDYSGITTDGIHADFALGTVAYAAGTGNVDNFTFFTEITGTSGDDKFLGLTSSSRVTIHAGDGDDTVSFTGSSSAINAEIKADGSIDVGGGNINIIKGTGTLITGGTRHDDTFYLLDYNTLSVNGGIDGEGGTNTFDFSKLTAGVTNFDILDTTGRNYQINNIQRYVFTNLVDQISWTVSTADFNVRVLDFGAGDDEFTVDLSNVSGAGTKLSAIFDGSGNTTLGVTPSGGKSQNLSLIGLEKLIFDAGSNSVDSLDVVLSGMTFTTGDIFPNVLALNNISFTGDVTYTYRNYTLTTFDTSTIVANVTHINLLGGAVGGNPITVDVKNSATQASSVNIRIDDVVTMNIDNSIPANSNITFNGRELVVATSATNSQTFTLPKITDSTLNINNHIFKVVSTTTIAMPKIITISSLNSYEAGLDFSAYSGQHGDWVFTSGKLSGSFANKFEISLTPLQNKYIPITLTATNDVFSIDQTRSAFGTWAIIDGGGGTNTFKLTEGASTDRLAGISNSNVIISKDNMASDLAGSNPIGLPDRDFKEAVNFTIFDARGDNINKDMDYNTIINVLLDSTSPWTDIYMPYANAANAAQDSMQRTILNAAGYDENGVNPTGGFAEGGIYSVGFEADPNDPTKMNRMMQVRADLRDDPNDAYRTFNVHNVQSIYGKRGKQDIVTFETLNTDQFEDLAAQLSQGKVASSGGNNAGNVALRKQYLYLDLDFTKDQTGDADSNNATGPEVDIIDFSAWVINNPNEAFDVAMEFNRGNMSGNALHTMAIGQYTEKGINAIVLTKFSGYQHFILPQTKFYYGNVSNYISGRYYILEFPDIQDTDYYAVFDNYTSNNEAMDDASLFRGATGKSTSSSPTGVEFINFTTFFLSRNGLTDSMYSDIKIGQDFATDGLYNSNNVYIYFDQSKTTPNAPKPDSDDRDNNGDKTSGGAYDDKVDFSAINSGSYYFSWGAWKDVEKDSKDFVSNTGNTNRQASQDYIDFITGTNTGVGIIFANNTDRFKVGTTDGLGRDVGAFYRMQGINILNLTSSSDTYALGEVYWNNTAGQGPVGALVNANKKTFVKSVEGGAGVDTFLDNTFTADTRKSGGGALSGRSEGTIDQNNPNSYNFYSYLRGGQVETGHIERVYFFDAQDNNRVLNMRAISTPNDAEYGTHAKGEDLASTGPQSGEDGKYTSEFSRPTYNNFEKLKVEDYDSTQSDRNGYLKGVQDNLAVKANSESTTNGTVYREFDLGGRYVSNEANGTIEKQNILHESSSSTIRFQFIQDPDSRVDSSVVIADGYSSGKYTSYYGYKNWDYIDFIGKNGAQTAFNFDFVFNTDFNFDKMNNKLFTVDVYAETSGSTLSMLFQQSKYNYTVSEAGGSDSSGNYKEYTISEDGSTGKSFKIRIYTNINPDFKPDATDADIQSVGTLTEQQLENLRTYGNLEGVVNEDSQNADSGNSSDGVSSYGSRTNKDNDEDDVSSSMAYSDGESGVTSFGRGRRSEDSKSYGEENSNKEESSKNNDSHNELPKEDFWWLSDEEKSENKEEAEDQDNSYSEESIPEEEDLASNEEDSTSNEEEDKSDDAENNSDSAKNEEQEEIALLDSYHDFINNDNSNNLNFDNFVEKDNDFNMDDLFNQAEDLLSNNVELSDSLNEMIETVNSLEEEAVNVTNQYDELDSMSFALDSMFSVDENTGHTEVGADNNNKNKNNNNFSNS